MKIEIFNQTENFETYRALRVKSLFNPERGDTFSASAEIDPPDGWKIGVVVGPSGSGKTSAGKKILPCGITDLYSGWPSDLPVVDAILPDGDFDAVTGALASVGLGDVPAWLRPFHALSNGQQFRAGLARVLVGSGDAVIDEFTSVVDRQIAKIGALAFSRSWKRQSGRRAVLLTPHYDILEWVDPDWVLDTGTWEFKKKSIPGQKLSYKCGRSTALTGSFLSRIII